jgi:hypothetical protein
MEVSVNENDRLYDKIYSANVLMARVGHLPCPMRQDVERIVRILRESYPASGIQHPKPRITRIMLLEPHAWRSWSMDEDSVVVPAFEFWIIVSDRLLTHRMVWQATEVGIRDAVEGCCAVSLSLTSSAGLKAGKRSGDEFVCDRLHTSILYRSKRDDPQSRRGAGRGMWTGASARFETAYAAFQPACGAFRDAERTYFALRAGRCADLTDEEDRDFHSQTRLDVAMAEEQRVGAELHEATMALLHTPAPDLVAIARKLELVRDEADGDDHAVVSILADVRWIAARLAACGRLS